MKRKFKKDQEKLEMNVLYFVIVLAAIVAIICLA